MINSTAIAPSMIDIKQIKGTSKFDFDDILLEPSEKSEITSRSQVASNYYTLKHNINSTGHSPLIAAPMSSVVDFSNKNQFLNLGINICVPRSIDLERRNSEVFFEHPTFPDNPMMFISYSLSEIKEIKKEIVKCQDYILIDLANGHMVDEILEAIERIKKFNLNLKVMVGNVANPSTFKLYAESGIVDYVRIGIGNGSGCLTTQQTGVGYPMASLINECSSHKKGKTKIVADGGFRKYADIIKALALGADYVMVGGILSETIESSGKKYLWNIPIPQKFAEKVYIKWKLPITKYFYGMSTKRAQKEMGLTKLKVSEGTIKKITISNTLEGLYEEFDQYLRSAMSYANITDIRMYIGNAKWNFITGNALNRFKK